MFYVSPEIWTKYFRHSIGGHFIFGHYNHGPMLLKCILFDSWPLKHEFGYHKCIYIAGLEIEISRKLCLIYGHGGHLEKEHLFIVGTLSENDTQSNIFFLYTISQNKINEPNIPYLVTKSYLGLSMAIWNKHFWHSQFWIW